MASRVFFSFHYEDVKQFRANVVRNHWVTKPDRSEAGYFDASIWESARLRGEEALKRLIDGELDNTSNTCVLVGTQTYQRQWVRYELLKSFLRGNHLFAVHINGIRGRDGKTLLLGENPLRYLGVSYSQDGTKGTLWEVNGSGEWVQYNRINGSSDFKTQVSEAYRGKGFNLSQWYPIYDWIANDGYTNFPSWVK